MVNDQISNPRAAIPAERFPAPFRQHQNELTKIHLILGGRDTNTSSSVSCCLSSTDEKTATQLPLAAYAWEEDELAYYTSGKVTPTCPGWFLHTGKNWKKQSSNS